MKEYKDGTQKAVLIQIMIAKNKWCEVLELTKFQNLFVGKNTRQVMQCLVKNGLVLVKYFGTKGISGKRAKYKLTKEAISFYSDLYGIDIKKDEIEKFKYREENKHNTIFSIIRDYFNF